MNKIGYLTKNQLLVQDDVGKCKPSTRKLPTENFTYGKADFQDVEGAGQVMSNWKFHGQSRRSQPDRDFTKLNKMSVKDRACNARDMYQFRQTHDARIKEASGIPQKRHRLPPQDFTYGIPLRPSTPIRDVMGNFFGEMAENEMVYKYQQTATNFRNSNMPTNAKHTTKSRIAHEFVRSKDQEDKKQAKLMSGSNDLFKIKRFGNAKPRTDTNNRSKHFRKQKNTNNNA